MKVVGRAKPKPLLSPGSRPGPKRKKKGYYRPKPIGRPWDRTTSRVCLICLRRYDLSDFETATVIAEDEDVEIIDLTCDPLAMDDPLKPNSPKAKEIGKPAIKPEAVNVKFLKIISRFVGIKTKNIRNLAEKNELPPSFCKDCFGIVQNFCDVYNEWQIANMTLHFRLKQIVDGIRNSNLKVSGKLGVTLHKALSTQLRMRSANLVQVFRKHLLLKCSGKAKTITDGLQVSLYRNAYQDYVRSRLKYPIEQMVGYLKSLIVVFALAVVPKVDKAAELSKHKGKLVRRSNQIEGQQNDEDHDDGEYSPPCSPAEPSSPVEGDNNDEIPRDSDTDWSGGGDDSDVDFSAGPSTSRRWNLRKRRNPNDSKDKENMTEVDNYADLPPLRSNKRMRPIVNEEDKKFPCNICSLRFVSESSLKRHISQVHPFILAYDCKQCPQRFKKRFLLDIHVKKVHRSTAAGALNRFLPKPTPCTMCHKTFPSKTKMFVHRRKAHKENLGTFTCEFCGKVVRCKFRLDKHIRTHTGQIDQFRCTHPKCNRIFMIENNLKQHLEFHEKNPDWEPKVRRGKQTNEKMFEGNLEGISRRKKGFFMCDFPDCKRFFYSESSLAAHVPLHESNSTFPCPICGKVFLQLKEISTHMKVHETGEKNYNCTHCDKAFTLKETCSIHLKSFHVIKLACDVDICTAEFESTDELREHLKEVHVPPDTVEIVAKVERGGIFNFKPKINKESEGQPMPEERTSKPEDIKVSADLSSSIQETNCKTNCADSATILKVTNASNEETSADSDTLENTTPMDSSASPIQDNIRVDSEDKNSGENSNLNDPALMATDESINPPLPPDSITTTSVEDGPASPADSTQGIADVSPADHTILQDDINESQKEESEACNTEKNNNEDDLNDEIVYTSDAPLGLYTCERCRWSFTNTLALSLHLVSHSPRDGKGMYSCNLCEASFRIVKSLQTHYNCRHGPGVKLISCAQCGQRFHRKESYNFHMKSHKDGDIPESFLCTECGEVLENNRAFQRHMRNHNRPERKVSNTKKSEKKVKVASVKTNTTNTTTNRNRFQCDECPETFDKESKLSVHQHDAHGKEKPFKCPEEGCTATFFTIINLKHHSLKHKGRNYLCPVCPKTYFRQPHLDEHMKVHSGERTIICEICGKSFFKQHILKVHMETHTEERKFKCSFCDKAFKRKFLMKQHEKIHSSERPYKCQYCGQGFKQKQSCTLHEKIHEKKGKVRSRRGNNFEEDYMANYTNNEGNEEQYHQGLESNAPTASGIIHEALQAAFNDITTELLMEPNITLNEEVKSENEEDNEDEFKDGSEIVQENHSNSQSTRSGRRIRPPPKHGGDGGTTRIPQETNSVVSNLSCGFCGKVFQREKPYRAHVQRHMTEAEASPTDDVTNEMKTEEPAQQFLNSHGEAYASNTSEPNINQFAPAASSSNMNSPSSNTLNNKQYADQGSQIKKRRGRPPKVKTESPGSRLERIVENVMTTATTSSSNLFATQHVQEATTRGESRHLQHQPHRRSQRHQHLVQSPIQNHNDSMQSPHHSQTPSPHSSYNSSSPRQVSQSGSERSTPTTTHFQNNLQNQVTSSAGSTFPPPTSSFLNSFLLSNPYLLSARQEASTSSHQSALFQMQQQGVNLSTHTQYPHQGSSRETHPNHFQYQQQQLLQQQQQQHQQTNNNTMPHDLSRSSYPMFFANPR